MRYSEHPVPSMLADVVRCIWRLWGEGPGGPGGEAEPAFPDGSPELIFHLGDPFEYLPGNGPAVTQPAAFLVGQITRPFTVRPTGRVDVVAVRFESHGASMLHRPMRELTDTWRPLAALGGVPFAVTCDQLRRGRTPEERVDRLVGALLGLRREARVPDAGVAAAVGAIRSSFGTVAVDELAAVAGVTPRSLQRSFADQVGVSPKALARTVRFQRVFAAVRDDPGSFSRVAYECGYADQSHLIRDFRALAGSAPTRLLSSMPEFTGFFTA